MPVVKRTTYDKRYVDSYHLHTEFMPYDEQATSLLRVRRREYVLMQDDFRRVQKDIGRPDTEFQRDCHRWLKESIKEYHRHEKAVTILLEWLEGTGSAHNSPWMWPLELTRELDLEAGAYYLALAGWDGQANNLPLNEVIK